MSKKTELTINKNELWRACVSNERTKGFRVENRSNGIKFVNLKNGKEWTITETAINKYINSSAVRNSSTKQIAYNMVLTKLFGTAKKRTK